MSSNPKESLIFVDELWNDYVILTELNIHDEEFTANQQRNHLHLPILRYEQLAQLFGTDDYLSVHKYFRSQQQR